MQFLFFKIGRRDSAVHEFEKTPYKNNTEAFSQDLLKAILMKKELSDIILNFLLLLPGGRGEFIDGIKEYLWSEKPELAARCDDLLVRCSEREDLVDSLRRKKVKSEEDFQKILEASIKDLMLDGPVSIDKINLLCKNRRFLCRPFLLIPFDDLSDQYFPYFKAFVDQLPTLAVDEKSEYNELERAVSVLFAHYFLFTNNKSTSYVLYKILSLINTNASMTKSILEWFILLSTGLKYTENTWVHFRHYLISRDHSRSKKCFF